MKLGVLVKRGRAVGCFSYFLKMYVYVESCDFEGISFSLKPLCWFRCWDIFFPTCIPTVTLFSIIKWLVLLDVCVFVFVKTLPDSVVSIQCVLTATELGLFCQWHTKLGALRLVGPNPVGLELIAFLSTHWVCHSSCDSVFEQRALFMASNGGGRVANPNWNSSLSLLEWNGTDNASLYYPKLCHLERPIWGLFLSSGETHWRENVGCITKRNEWSRKRHSEDSSVTVSIIFLDKKRFGLLYCSK